MLGVRGAMLESEEDEVESAIMAFVVDISKEDGRIALYMHMLIGKHTIWFKFHFTLNLGSCAFLCIPRSVDYEPGSLA
jgi:hypothetical protein